MKPDAGHVIYARNGSVFAVPFDLNRLQVTGQPVMVLEGVLMSRYTGVANFEMSLTGDLVYVPGMKSSIVTSRSRFCRTSSSPILIGARGSRVKRKWSPR